VTVGFWHEYSRILQRNSLYTLRPNHNGDCYTIHIFTVDYLLQHKGGLRGVILITANHFSNNL
ncbi:hypothetical protein, partial [Nostoc sp.]|uniref:hypothetical protein n=1 Tax=Nostoc sp. TaxID=1180 RepID=UPI002FFAC972